MDTRPSARFRPEIEGLRALACALVVVFHVWSDRISGGVDVFFLLTGFLLTGQLVRAGSSGQVDVGRVWRRAVRRLAPAALTVLLVSVAVSAVVLPASRWSPTVEHALASAFSVENWKLAAETADYFARNGDTSITQHFWSLSIQGQVYLLWPLLVAGVAVLAGRRFRDNGLPSYL